MQKYYKKNKPTVLESLFVEIGRGIWFLISLPFRKRKKAGLSSEDRNYITKKRYEIEGMLKSDNNYELRHAVIEADKLVDYILRKKGYNGETFADRLRNAEGNINHHLYQNIWQGHKIRNQIAHDEGNINKEVLIRSVQLLLSSAEAI